MLNFCNVILKQKDGYFWISIFSYFFLELDYTTHCMFLAHYEPTHMSLFVSVWLLCWHFGLLVSCFSFVVKFEDSLWISSFIVSRCYIYWVPLYFLGLGCVPWHLVGVLSSSSCLFSIVCLLCCRVHSHTIKRAICTLTECLALYRFSIALQSCKI